MQNPNPSYVTNHQLHTHCLLFIIFSIFNLQTFKHNNCFLNLQQIEFRGWMNIFSYSPIGILPVHFSSCFKNNFLNFLRTICKLIFRFLTCTFSWILCFVKFDNSDLKVDIDIKIYNYIHVFRLDLCWSPYRLDSFRPRI